MSIALPVPMSWDVAGADFWRTWFAPHQPVVLTDLAIGAAAAWTPARLVQLLGDTPVEVMTGWSASPADNVYLTLDSHRATMGFREYASLVAAGRPDVYMVANNPLLSSDAGRPLWQDLHPDPRYLVVDPERTFLWFGPQGTVTHYHYDTVSVLFFQIMGTKRWSLVPPDQGERMYRTTGVYSAVDVTTRSPDQPLFDGVVRADFDLHPGQALLVPAGWWHAVQGLEESISVSFTSFAWPNDPLAG